MNRLVHSVRVSLIVFLLVGGSGATGSEAVRPGWLGFGFVASKRAAGEPIRYLLVRFVAQAGPADKAGLRPGDLVVGIGDSPLVFRNDLEILEVLSKTHAGEALLLNIARGKERRRVKVIAAEMDDDQFITWQHNLLIARRADQNRTH